MKILKSDEEAAQLDEESRELEAIVQQAAEDTFAAAEAHVTSVSDGSNVGDSSQRYHAPQRPSKAYMFWRSGENISDLVVILSDWNNNSRPYIYASSDCRAF